MTPPLRWRDAARDDRQLLQAFTCTPPPRRTLTRRAAPIAREWEREVEAGLRDQKPPIGDGRLILGEDEAGLAAVVLVYFRGYQDEAYLVRLAAVAVALRCRGCRYGDLAMEQALTASADEGFGSGHLSVWVDGLVDPRNEGSRAMNHRAGLACVGMDPTGKYEVWGRELDLPQDVQ